MNLLTLPWRNIAAQKVRSTLTVLGIAVAVGAFIALTGLTRGMQYSFDHGLGDIGADYVVSQRNTYSLTSSSVSEDIGPKLAAVPGVAAVSGVVLSVTEVDNEANIFVTGWPDDSFLWQSLKLASGRPPQGDREVVLGQSVARALGKGVGDTISMQYEDFRISGLAVSTSVFNQNIAVTRLAVLQDMLGRPSAVSLYQVRLERPFTPERAEEIRAGLAAVSPLIDVSNSEEFAGNMQFEKTMDAVAKVVSLLMILASSILVANTLLMSVSERGQEFGILAAIGWTPARVRMLVVAEGVMMCVLGSVIGIGLGVFAMYVVSWMRIFAGLLEPYLTTAIVAQAVGWVLLVGPLSALYPAWRVTRIPPSAAIRGQR
ncbi:ABC transporter permease [Limimaricola sp.]|uniref:ABC transporter permease n=1 Tax=Limimaricola sp. TaxID=2211665 RepID=UPI0025C3088B|nr:ABC transporter permease [Limimaricola sp.]